MGKIDSDKDKFSVDGKILSIVRGRPSAIDVSNTPYQYTDKLVTLVIEADMKKYTVDFPIKTTSDIELMPYHSALLGTDVKYIKTGAEYKRDAMSGFQGHDEWQLEILSGCMKGVMYTGKQ